MVYISALRYYNIRAGHPNPSPDSYPRLTYILKGIHRDNPEHQSKHRLPVTMDILRHLHRVWSKPPITHDKTMLWAACCLGFFGFLRAGEFTYTQNSLDGYCLSAADISINSRSNPQLLTVHLKQSKTDPYGSGCRIYLGRTNTIPCPVSAILSYLSYRPSTSGPLFILQDGTPLSRPKLVSSLREALSKAGINASHYSGHSFRIGAATAAAQAGYSDSFIQTLGRWKSSSFITYIRTPPAKLAMVAATLTQRCQFVSSPPLPKM